MTNQKHKARNLIESMNRGRLQATCPCCDETISIRDSGLFHLKEFSPQALELYQRNLEELKMRRKSLIERKKTMHRKTFSASSTTNFGKNSEVLAPVARGFKYHKGDVRAILDPIDYVIFEGLAQTGKVNRLIFADFKTGNAKLSGRQKSIREIVEMKKVSMKIYEKK